MSHEALGAQFHPHVQQYRSGGIGHLPGDESRSTVGFVPTHILDQYREHDGRQFRPEHDRPVIEGIRKDIREGVGIKEPIQLYHDDKEHWGVIAEGNHRLAAAREEGVPVVPVRVHSRVRDARGGALARSEGAPGQNPQGGAPLKMATDFSHGDFPYTPPELHPLHFEQFKNA